MFLAQPVSMTAWSKSECPHPHMARTFSARMAASSNTLPGVSSFGAGLRCSGSRGKIYLLASVAILVTER